MQILEEGEAYERVVQWAEDFMAPDKRDRLRESLRDVDLDNGAPHLRLLRVFKALDKAEVDVPEHLMSVFRLMSAA